MLNEKAQAFVDRVAGAPAFSELGIEAMRANGARLRKLGGPVEEIARTEDIEIPGANPVTVRRYSPVATGTARPTLVFAHGGGWIAGDIDEIDAPLTALANRSGWDVVSVRYRLAPEHPYPAGANDVFTALEWAAEGASALAIAGESAGGALAVGAASEWTSRERAVALDLLIGIYPALGADLTLPSFTEQASYGMKTADVAWFLENYLPAGVDRTGAIPLEAPSVAGLPRTYIVSAEHDVLIDEANAFTDRLRAEGVQVEHDVLAGSIHGFFGLGKIMDESATAVERIAARLRDIAAQ